MTILVFVFLGHLQNMQLYYMQPSQPVRSNIDLSRLISVFIYIACVIDRFFLTDWRYILGFRLSYALGDLAIARTSEITPNLSSQKVVGKHRPTVHLEHPDSFSQ